MTHNKARICRAGFTLLELVLAVTIGVVLLAALYLALATQFYHARAGREVLEEAAVVRSLFARITADVVSSLGPPSVSSTGETVGASNRGVFGDNQRLVLSVSQVPRELDPMADAKQANVCDLRMITYWLVSQGDQARGLARQEVRRVTGPEADSLPPDVPEPESYLVSTQVRDFRVEYHDGAGWQSSWDGTSVDGVSQKAKGPPAAVAVTLTVQPVDGKATRTYRQVIAVPAANRWVPSGDQ